MENESSANDDGGSNNNGRATNNKNNGDKNVINHFSGNFYGSAFGPNSNVNNLGSGNREPSWEDVFAWLTEDHADLNYFPLQADLKKQCQPDLGQWFLKAENFRKWETGDYQTLFCYGARKLSSGSYVSVLTQARQVVSGRPCSCE